MVWGAYFGGSGTIIMAVPYYADVTQRDGTTADRSVAFYFQGSNQAAVARLAHRAVTIGPEILDVACVSPFYA